MSTGQIKFLCWIAALGLAGYLGYNIYEFWRTNEPWQQGLRDTEAMRNALENIEKREVIKANIVKYSDVRLAFHDFDWTGEPPKEKPKAVVDDKPKVKPKIPVADLIVVQLLQVDTELSENSSAFIIYKTGKVMPSADLLQYGQLLRVGDTLYEPHDWAKVHEITRDGVVFSFEDGRDNETVAPGNTSESLITYTDPDGVIRPKPGTGVVVSRPGPAFVPKQTYERRPNEFRIGTEDRDDIAENYASILSRDVRHRRHRDPKTGRYDGIEIQSVTAGSIAARHGAQSGDVIKSINGHPVTSVAEAITFVKNNKDKYTSWEVEIENQGKVRTVTYESPPE